MDHPGVGTGVYIRKGGKVLFGKRRGKHGAGTWCPPGGKVELFEEWADNCVREVQEEASVMFDNLRLVAPTNDIAPEYGTHYVTLHFVADWVSGEPVDKPDERIGEWGWFSWDELPEPLFAPTRNFVKNGYNPLTL